MDDEIEKCKCGSPGEEPHTCPYYEELYQSLTECNCCSTCVHECCMDI